MEIKLIRTLLAIALIASVLNFDFVASGSVKSKKKDRKLNRNATAEASAVGKATQRINIGGSKVSRIPPPMALMYETVYPEGRAQLYFRCSGVLILHDLILTTEECRSPTINSSRESVIYWDITKDYSNKREPDEGMIRPNKALEASYKGGNFDRFTGEHCDGSQLLVYELPVRIEMFQNWIYSAKIPDRQRVSFSWISCAIFGYGGNEVIKYLEVEETKDKSCTQGLNNTENIACFKSKYYNYNLCQADAGAPILCGNSLYEDVSGGYDGDLGDIYVYGFVANRKPTQYPNPSLCDKEYDKDNDLIQVIKVTMYSEWLSDIIKYKRMNYLSENKKVVTVTSDSAGGIFSNGYKTTTESPQVQPKRG